jgi:hypothetical protein
MSAEVNMENAVELKHLDITDKVLSAFFKEVYPSLGYGFLEKVYENAMVIALRQKGLFVQQQAKISVYFEGKSLENIMLICWSKMQSLLSLRRYRKSCQNMKRNY